MTKMIKIKKNVYFLLIFLLLINIKNGFMKLNNSLENIFGFNFKILLFLFE
jgi:hypothetical protein